MKDRKRVGGTVKFANKKPKKDGVEVVSAEERERRKQSLYRVPTSEELTELRENENLYKDNLFRLQIQYLLEEVCFTDTKEKRINDVLHSLNTFLTSLQPHTHDPCNISHPDCLPDDIPLPLPPFIPKEKVKCKFQFVPPLEVKIIGSFLLKTLTKSDTCIDVAVEIPPTCLQPRDVLNFRYHFKRASYLAWVAHHLASWEHTESMSFKCDADPYMPTLMLKLKGKVGKKYTMNIRTKLPHEFFKASQLGPLRNNVRRSWFNGTEDGADELAHPTPHYNSSILSDLLHESHLKAVYTAMNECPGMKDAISLFKLWTTQRSFKSVCVFNSFVGGMLMVYLLAQRKISSHMSSYQIFRILLHFVASTDLSVEGITLCEDDNNNIHDFHNSFPVVFVDVSGSLNLCANLDAHTYQWIRHQAKLSLDILDNSSSAKGFDGLFMKSYDFLQCADQCFKLTKLDRFRKHVAEKETSDFIDHGGNWSALLPRVLKPVLEKGLGQRVHRLIVKPMQSLQWDVSVHPPDTSQTVFWYGLQLNTEFANNVLIMGPPADQPEAKEFASFWGDKSELRRFQDGCINEAVLWQCASGEEKSLISERIVKHLLKRHCHISESSVSYYGGEFDFMSGLSASVTSVLGAEENLHFMKNFSELTKQIQAMKDVPLTIKSIDGIDASFRFADPIIPTQHVSTQEPSGSRNSILLPKHKKKCTTAHVHNAIVQFESCGKWPDEIEAIQHIKAAFHNQLAECIQTQLHMPCVATPLYVDVLKNGFVFRLRVVHYREMVLYREAASLATSAALKKEHEVSADALDVLIVKRPLHTSLIHGLNSHYHAYAPTVRLAKRWIASQMFSGYLSEEAIELIVASIFVGAEHPNSAMCGFLRFLRILAKFDWKTEPLIVNLNGEMKSEEIHAIQENFTTNRTQHPTMFISTPYSHNRSIWTQSNPSQQILLRMKLLADAALKLCSLDGPHVVSRSLVKQMFRPAVGDFDVVIEVNKMFVPLHHMSLETCDTESPQGVTGKSNLTAHALPVVEFNPVHMFVEELREAFNDVAMFFWDVYGGLKIGVVWKRNNLGEQTFKILNAQYKTVAEKESTSGLCVVPNIPAIISDFKIMGRGLVSSIEELKPIVGK